MYAIRKCAIATTTAVIATTTLDDPNQNDVDKRGRTATTKNKMHACSMSCQRVTQCAIKFDR